MASHSTELRAQEDQAALAALERFWHPNRRQHSSVFEEVDGFYDTLPTPEVFFFFVYIKFNN